MRNLIFLFSILIILLPGCRKDDPTVSVDPELSNYTDRFYQEASLRNASLSAEFSAFLVDNIEGSQAACGRGLSPNLFPEEVTFPTIFIDRDCWVELNEISREILVFHEMGHALLDRSHTDGVLANGYQKSIMCGGTEQDCSDFPDYGFCTEFREYYLDEIFDIATPEPEWSLREWSFASSLFSDLNDQLPDGWIDYSNCREDRWEFSIDSISSVRPSHYCLRMDSDCFGPSTVRKEIPIEGYVPGSAVRIRMDIFTKVDSGPGIQVQIWARSGEDFIAFQRTSRLAQINGIKQFENLELQLECIGPSMDMLVLDFIVLENTKGAILVGNLDVELWE